MRPQDICKYVKKEGAGCSMNNFCNYPNCVIEQLQKELEDIKNRVHPRHWKEQR